MLPLVLDVEELVELVLVAPDPFVCASVWPVSVVEVSVPLVATLVVPAAPWATVVPAALWAL